MSGGHRAFAARCVARADDRYDTRRYEFKLPPQRTHSVERRSGSPPSSRSSSWIRFASIAARSSRVAPSDRDVFSWPGMRVRRDTKATSRRFEFHADRRRTRGRLFKRILEGVRKESQAASGSPGRRSLRRARSVIDSRFGYTSGREHRLSRSVGSRRDDRERADRIAFRRRRYVRPERSERNAKPSALASTLASYRPRCRVPAECKAVG